MLWLQEQKILTDLQVFGLRTESDWKLKNHKDLLVSHSQPESKYRRTKQREELSEMESFRKETEILNKKWDKIRKRKNRRVGKVLFKKKYIYFEPFTVDASGRPLTWGE